MSLQTTAPAADEDGAPLSPALRRIAKPAEVAVLCAIARARIADASLLRERLSATIDWTWLLTAARASGVMPLLACHLRAHSDRVPAEVLARIETELRQNTFRNLALAAELKRLLELLRENSVEAMPLKGPVLADVLYGNIGLRQCTDVDILIRRKDFEPALAILRSGGYVDGYSLTPAQQSAYLRNACEYPLFSPTGTLVEIQWRMAARYFCLDPEPDLWHDAQTITAAGLRCAAPSWENLLLYLCVHGGKHLWSKLIWVADVAEIIRQRDLDWDIVLRGARQCGAVRLLFSGLCAAREFLGATLPPPIERELRSDRVLIEIADSFCARLAGAEVSPGKMHALSLRLRERRRDRVRYVFRLATTPALGEWEMIRLPGPLSPLYPLLRAFRLATKKWT